MKTVFFCLTVVVLSFSLSCGNSQSVDASEIVPREEMIEILTDIQIFESVNQIRKDRSKEGFELYRAYKWVFEQHDITEEIFRRSLEHYAEDPIDFEAIYDEVMIRISEKQAEVTAS